MSIPASVAHTVQQTQEWLKELRDNSGFSDETESLSVLRAVLHQLRDRLSAEEAVDLGAQLPTLLRGFYYEGWTPSSTPEKIRTKREFLDNVTIKLLPHPIAPELAVKDVFALIAHHCDPGEVADVIGQLPDEIKALWPEHARTFRQRAS